MTHLIGQQLGSYRLTRLLGRGGFAEVYLGEHTLIPGKRTAIKVLNEQFTDAELQGFCKEVTTISFLVHPLIVRVLDFGVEGNTPFLVMDYAPHGTLRQRHLNGTPVPLSTILGYVRQVAEALQYAHAAGIIHRDIKPENLLVGEHDQILLSDFGIAIKAHRPISQTPQNITGTALYMAPEQCEGKACQASDQYALAVLVYEWLSGEPPFAGNDPINIVLHHLQHLPPPLRMKLPTLAPEVEQVVLKALAKNPNERFPNVLAFATALEAADQKAPSKKRMGTKVLSSPPISTSHPLPAPTQQPSPADLLLPDPSSPLTSRNSPRPEAPAQNPRGSPSQRPAQSENSAKSWRDLVAMEKGVLQNVIGGLVIALMGIWFIAQNGGQSLAVSWVVGGMAVVIGCAIIITVLLL